MQHSKTALKTDDYHNNQAVPLFLRSSPWYLFANMADITFAGSSQAERLFVIFSSPVFL